MNIVDWYNGRSVLVTGGTGFMGKVLLEKLLRALTGLRTVYIIIREKRGVLPQTRIENIIKLPVFQKLRESNPNVFKKLIAIEGDITMENLGISETNRKLLQSEVSVVFHNAATLRLEAVMKESVKHNLIGTENVLKFCRKMKKLQAFLHLSTAFCHCDVEVLEEKIYPPTQNPRDILNLVKWIDDQSLELLTPNIIKPHPNTYTFTKRLAETVVQEYGKEMPTIILRPSIVIPVLKEPLPGWVDSLNGPVGVLAAAGKGVIRSMLVEGSNNAELIPVDIAINAMIVGAWHRAVQIEGSETPVYNISQSNFFPITWGEILNIGKRAFQEIAFEWPLWYPDGDIRTNRLTHYLIVYLFQILPAYFLDIIFLIIMQKRFMVRIQNRIWLGMHLLQYFTLRAWKFQNDKLFDVFKKLSEQERAIFYCNNVTLDVDEYMKQIIMGTRTYCLKENPKSLQSARRYLKFLYLLDRVTKAFIFFGLIWCFFKLTNIFQSHHNFYNTFEAI